MPRTPNPRKAGCPEWSAIVVLTFVLAGCHSQKQLVYEDDEGFRFVPPPGWVERARGDAMPAGASRRQQNLPLPPLGVRGRPQERLLVRYDRISTSHHAWLRITVADLPASTPLKACLSTCVPERGWKRESEEEGLEVGGLPGASIAFVGRSYDQDYLCQTFAVRKGEKVYLFSAAFPTSDNTAREQIRQAVLQASWQK
jgi:hypothetical protein